MLDAAGKAKMGRWEADIKMRETEQIDWTVNPLIANLTIRTGRPELRPEKHVLSRNGEPIDTASLIFDAEWYVQAYPDVGTAGIDPVQHYLQTGFREGRNPNPYFDTGWYVAAYPDVASHGEDPFLHYIFYGAREGRKPHAPELEK